MSKPIINQYERQCTIGAFKFASLKLNRMLEKIADKIINFITKKPLN